MSRGLGRYADRHVVGIIRVVGINTKVLVSRMKNTWRDAPSQGSPAVGEPVVS
jgi:hypothetical protein